MKKKTTTASNSDTIIYPIWRNLPSKIIAEVLSRLPIKSLCRFRCVSPKTHLHITNTANKPQKTLLISTSCKLFSVDFTDESPTAKRLGSGPSGSGNWVQVFGSCNGLVLVCGEGIDSYFLSNPFTGECKKLLEPPFLDISSSDQSPFFLAGLGYESSTDDYKVVMLLGFDGLHFYILGEHLHGSYFNERLHWLCSSTGDFDGPKVIVAFDLCDEIFKEVQLPAPFDNDGYSYYQLVVLRGCLCLVVWPFIDYGIEVWIMKKYGRKTNLYWEHLA
ncbi:F-box/kelch-repeat protein At3g06240-like [Rhododendron vialii]|uniref:F-box/kelch-repeat protein At3g06240-like n=1 Tax=Rhododendron vialii TaxID=182163 RepID=UPI00265FD718|nr:F-box/kelch-repeat protein At3g06240-like [Rhododendron vialii]